MNVGFIPFFGWRPHNQHFLYLVRAVRALGHTAEVLKCDGQIRTCYNQEIKKGTAKRLACTTCKLSAKYVTQFADKTAHFSEFGTDTADVGDRSQEWVKSSYRTLKRTETAELSDGETQTDLFRDLQYSAEQTYQIVTNWIETHNIDFVFFFNGRMDITRAALEACKDKNVGCASVERSVFNWGIQIYPGYNCMDFTYPHETTAAFVDAPLNREAADFAGSILATRLFNIHENSTEWRTYNKDRIAVAWPGEGAKRVLLLPSSANEIEGEPSYEMDWASTVDAFEAVLNALDLGDNQVVMRGHPNWSENIGSASGDASNAFYQKWCADHDVIYVPPNSFADTNSLIAQCDMVVLSHSSAAIEAGGLGKPVINIRPTLYSGADISLNMRGPAELAENIVRARGHLENYDAAVATDVKRKLLRFLFTVAKRVPMFADTVRPKGSADTFMFEPVELDRLNAILQSGGFLPSTQFDAAPDTSFEDAVLAAIADRSFEVHDLGDLFQPSTAPVALPLKFSLAAWLRSKLRRGDH